MTEEQPLFDALDEAVTKKQWTEANQIADLLEKLRRLSAMPTTSSIRPSLPGESNVATLRLHPAVGTATAREPVVGSGGGQYL